MKNNKTAVVIGATGLVGKQLVNQLLAHNQFDQVTVLVRRSTGLTHAKLNEVILNFDELAQTSNHIKGDVLFSCMGTTIKQAKTKDNQFRVDFTYQFETAQIAAKNKVNTYVLVSSIGADAKSSMFYSRIKGELEDAVTLLPFPKIRILRPSILQGDRTEFRFGERIGITLTHFFGLFIPPLRKWRAIKDVQVAQAMIGLALDGNPDKLLISEREELFEF